MKKKEPILDIIVPCYKASKFIGTFERVLFSSELEGKVRFLLIDDGSPDETFSKIKEICHKFPNYFFPYTKKNGGHGSVINFGISVAKAKYFRVMDSDDYLEIESLKRLVNFLETSDFDAVVTNYTFDYTVTKKIIVGIPWLTSETESDNLDECNEWSICLSSATFKLEMWKKKELKVREGVFYEDVEYSSFPLRYIKKCKFIPIFLYHYMQYEGLKPDQSMALNFLLRHINDHKLVLKDLFDFYKTWKDASGKTNIKLFERQLIGQVSNHYKYLMLADERNKKDILDFDLAVRSLPASLSAARHSKSARAARLYAKLPLRLFKFLFKKHYLRNAK